MRRVCRQRDGPHAAGLPQLWPEGSEQRIGWTLIAERLLPLYSVTNDVPPAKPATIAERLGGFLRDREIYPDA